MRKKGFTIQEVLITIAIVGVVAAIITPAVQKIMPDKTKAQYMKVYNTLNSQVIDIMDDPSLYWTTYDNNGNPICAGLQCTDQPAVAPYSTDNNCRGASKLAAILAHRLNLAGDPTYHSNPGQVPSRMHFTTTDGTTWYFETFTFPFLNSSYYTVVEINFSQELDEKTFADDNQDPLKFTFLIQKDGEVIPTDALGIVFLQNSTNFHSAKEDRNLAAEIIAKTGDEINTYVQKDGSFKGNSIPGNATKIQTLAKNRQEALRELKTKTSQ